MPSTPTTEPSVIIAGDTLAWRREDLQQDYPASTWTLAYRLLTATGHIAITAAADGDAFAVNVAAATTASYPSGSYTWVASVSAGTQRYQVDQGSVVVRPNLAAASSSDQRSAARKALEACDVALASYGAKAYLADISIAGRRQTFRSPAEFMAFRSKLQAEVAAEDNAERIANGLAPRNKLLVRFR